MSRAMAHNKHNQYGDYDYGLIELEEDLEFSERVQPIKLADADYENIAAGTKCVVSGWGDTHSPKEGGISRKLVRIRNAIPVEY